jgi:hypothetical protein
MIALAAIAGTGGYYLRALNDKSVRTLSTRQVPGTEFFTDQQSFSEVKNARELLRASAIHFIAEIRTHYDLMHSAQPVGNAPREGALGSCAIKELEQGMKEFEGNETENLFVNELLWLFWREGLHERWLDLYLKTVHQQPKYSGISYYADRAINVAFALGRLEEVTSVLERLREKQANAESKRQSLTSLHKPDVANPAGIDAEPPSM